MQRLKDTTTGRSRIARIDTKSEVSVRTIGLPPFLLTLLRGQRVKQQQEAGVQRAHERVREERGSQALGGSGSDLRHRLRHAIRRAGCDHVLPAASRSRGPAAAALPRPAPLGVVVHGRRGGRWRRRGRRRGRRSPVPPGTSTATSSQKNMTALLTYWSVLSGAIDPQSGVKYRLWGSVWGSRQREGDGKSTAALSFPAFRCGFPWSRPRDSNPRPAVYEWACRVCRAVSPPIARRRFPRRDATFSRPSLPLPAAVYRRLSSEWG